MKTDFKETIAKQIVPIWLALRRYLPVLLVVLFVGIYSFLIMRINTLIESEPDDAEISEELQSVRRPKIDEKAARKIEQLESQNIEVKTLFDAARRNPFAE